MKNLFPGEEINIEDKIIQRNQLDDNELNQIYEKGDSRILIEQARYPLSSFVETFTDEVYTIQPDFQRRRRWDNVRKSRLIESIIINVPIPPVFLYEVDLSKFQVMDGQQRLTTLKDFFTDKFELEGLEIWPQLNARKYSTLPGSIKKGIDRRFLSAIIILKESGKERQQSEKLMQLVFERVNSGGITLEPQESRNALLRGPMNDLCNELAENEIFKLLWDIPTENFDDACQNKDYKEMFTSELILRFFMRRQQHNFTQFNTLKAQLDKYQEYANKFNIDVIESLKKLFIETIIIIYKVLGESAFYAPRLNRSGTVSMVGKPALVMFEPMMLAFSAFFLNDKYAAIEQYKEKIASEINSNVVNNHSEFKGRQTHTPNIFLRTKIIRDSIEVFVK